MMQLEDVTDKIEEGFDEIVNYLDGKYSTLTDKMENGIEKVVMNIFGNIQSGLEEIEEVIVNKDRKDNFGFQLQMAVEESMQNQQHAIKELMENIQEMQLSKKQLRQIEQIEQRNENNLIEQKMKKIDNQNNVKIQLVSLQENEKYVGQNVRKGQEKQEVKIPDVEFKEEQTKKQIEKQVIGEREGKGEVEVEKNKTEQLQTQKQKQEDAIDRERVHHSDIRAQKSHPHHSKNINIFRISKDATRKLSAQKSQEAQSFLKANIDFLRYMRGGPMMSTLKKQWKQDSPTKKSALQQVKDDKKKMLEQLGFKNSSKVIEQSSSSSQLHENIKQIRSSRKKGQAFKPAAFSIYSIIKNNQKFMNNPSTTL